MRKMLNAALGACLAVGVGTGGGCLPTLPTPHRTSDSTSAISGWKAGR